MSKPNVKELEALLDDLVDNWDSFGRQLPGIKESAINEIKYNNRKLKSQKAALYSKWLEVYPDASWDDVISGLHVIGENAIVKHIQESLLSVDRQMSLSPKQAEVRSIELSVTYNPKQCTVPENIVQVLDDLHEAFVPLVTEVRSELIRAVDDGKVSVDMLTFHVREQLSFGPSHAPPIANATNTDQIFKSVENHYTFLSPSIILDLAIFFLSNHPIAKKADEYTRRIVTFKNEVGVRSLKNELGRFCQQLRNSASDEHVILTVIVTNAWGGKSIRLVETLLQTLFPIVHPDDLPWYSVCAGSLLLSFIATKHMMPQMIISCARKVDLMRYLGIISVTISNVLIRVSEPYNDSFSFQDSLIQAIASDNVEAVDFLLKYAQVDVNAVYTDTTFLLKNELQLDKKQYDQTEANMLANLGFYVVRLKVIRDEILQHLASDVDPFSDLVNRNTSELLHHIEHHVLNINYILNKLPSPIKESFSDICKLIDSLKKIAKIGHLQKFLRSVPSLSYTTQVAVTLHNVWKQCNVDYIEKLISFLFPLSPIDEFYWFQVKQSIKALKVELLITPNQDNFFFDHTSAKSLGVIKAKINNKQIFKSKENKASYTFEMGIHNNVARSGIAKFLKCVIDSPCPFVEANPLDHDHNDNIQMIPIHIYTPLTIACCKSNSQLVQCLLDHGADPNIEKEAFKRALFYCTNSSKIFQMLLDYGAQMLDDLTKSHDTILHHACLNGNVKVVDILLNNKFPYVDSRDAMGFTALWRACSKGYLDVVKRLLKGKADPNIANDLESVPLLVACSKGYLPIVKELLRAKADLNKRDGEGKTPLWWASSGGYAAVVQCLLDAQADPHIPDNEGVTPFQKAGRNPRRIRIASILFNHILTKCETNEERLAWIADAAEQLTMTIVFELLRLKEDPSRLDYIELYVPPHIGELKKE